MQFGVFCPLQVALGDALLHQGETLGCLPAEHLVVADADEVVAVFGPQRFGFVGGLGLLVFVGALDHQVAQTLVPIAFGPGAQNASRKTFVDHLLALIRVPGLHGQLGHFHVVVGLGHAAGGQAQAIRVKRKPVTEVGLALQAAQQVGPVFLFGVIGDEFFDRVDIAAGVVLLQRRVHQQLDALFRRRIAGSLGSLDLGAEFALRPCEIARKVLALDQQGSDGRTAAAFLEVALAPLHGAGVVAGPIAATRERFDHSQLVGGVELGIAANGIERFGGGVEVARA